MDTYWYLNKHLTRMYSAHKKEKKKEKSLGVGGGWGLLVYRDQSYKLTFSIVTY